MSDDPMLSGAAKRAMERAAEVYVSSATVWEVGMKAALGKLAVDMDELLPKLSEAGFEQLAVTWEHGRAVRDLPHCHRDPFDRMLIAQAITGPMRLLAHDETLARYTELVLVV